MATAVERTDEHVREYLVYRGFTSTLKQMDADLKNDKDRGFRVDRIVDQLVQLIQTFDLAGLKEYWSRLDRRLFSRLEDVYRSTVSKLHSSLYRFYLVNTIQKGNTEKTQEFFYKLAPELQAGPEWRDWFVLPFVPAPEQNPAFSPYFSRQWADTFLVSLHNFLSVLFQCMPQPALLSFDIEVQRMTSLCEENERLQQKLFVLQAERCCVDADTLVHHKLPAYVQNMDRLGDTELDLVPSQRVVSAHTPASRNFFSTLLPQAKRTTGVRGTNAPPPVPMTTSTSSSPSQGTLGRKDPATNQTVRCVAPPLASSEAAAPPSCLPPRHRKHQDHEKERQELFSKPQVPERRCGEEQEEASSRSPAGGAGEQPFIKLSQEEYAEHHSSIMHCRVDCSGRRVASLDVDGVIKVWSFNPSIQTRATVMSKSPLLSLEWATKPDRLLLLGSGVGTVRLYDTDVKKSLYEMNIDESHPSILSLACSPSGSSFVCSAAAPLPTGAPYAPGRLLLWDTKTVKQQLQFCLEPTPVAVNCTSFNHNGNLLVCGAADGLIRLFDMQQFDSVLSWRAHEGEVYSVEFSYDENTVFSIGEDGKFVQWNIHRCGVKQAEQLLSQNATGPFVLSGYSGYRQVQVPRGRLFAFDSEGKHVLTCSGSGGVIYQLTNGEPPLRGVASLGGHKAPVVTVDWCSAEDCGSCLTASMDGKICLSTLLAQDAPY